MNELNHGEMQSALFAQLVMQQANMAMMLLGKTPNPESGETMRDLGAAQLFIGQLEMLETKTKGNLNPQEAALLKQTLMTLHMAYVETVDAPVPSPAEKTATPATDRIGEDSQEKSPPTEVAGGEESAKKFSKKYS